MQAELPEATAASFCFQAEDGIRVGTVTGVQTCALPISSRRRRTCPAAPGGPGPSPRGPRPRRAGRSLDELLVVALHVAAVPLRGPLLHRLEEVAPELLRHLVRLRARDLHLLVVEVAAVALALASGVGEREGKPGTVPLPLSLPRRVLEPLLEAGERVEGELLLAVAALRVLRLAELARRLVHVPARLRELPLRVRREDRRLLRELGELLLQLPRLPLELA